MPQESVACFFLHKTMLFSTFEEKALFMVYNTKTSIKSIVDSEKLVCPSCHIDMMRLSETRRKEADEMKKLMMKFGNLFAALALVAVTLNVNSTCGHYIYQAPIPESAKKLSKIR